MSVTLLRSLSGMLAKVWMPDGNILAAANVAWFEARTVEIKCLSQLHAVIHAFEDNPHVALVKEAIAPDADPARLRRTCVSGVDRRTGEAYPAGLRVIPTDVLVLDIDRLPLPEGMDWRDGDGLASYLRRLLPAAFRRAACVWQFSGSSGHPTKRGEIRLHLFFYLDEPVLPKAWKRTFSHLPFVDQSALDNAKLIFTAAPVVDYEKDPIAQRHGMLAGEPVVRVPPDVKACSEFLAQEELRPKTGTKSSAFPPMPEAAAKFVEIISTSNILRSQHPAYHGERARRLAFCSMIAAHFGVTDDATLEAAFYDACIGDADPNGEHDAQQALDWAKAASPSGRSFSVPKLLRDAATALHEIGETALANCAARLAITFTQIEQEFVS